MFNFCNRKIKSTTVSIYIKDQLVKRATAYINLAVQPKISICQRLCRCNNLYRIKAIIHIINYEYCSIENLYLVYSIVNILGRYKLNKSTAIYHNENNHITIQLPPLLPQSITTYEIFANLKDCGKIKSCASLKAFCNGNNKYELIKNCICESEI